MTPQIAVLDVLGQYRVHTEFYRAPTDAPTIVLVNGSFATTASFSQAVRGLRPHLNVVLYDQPYAGRSRPYNRSDRLMSRHDESQLLLELIRRFQAQYLMSFSWGGTCALQALAERPASIQGAVVSSFSARINPSMRDYLQRGSHCLQHRAHRELGPLINGTLGKHLPSLLRRFNHKHLSSLADHEYRQMHRHLDDALSENLDVTLRRIGSIRAPVLFVNGDLDEYTTVGDARLFGEHLPRCRFTAIANAGHFLHMEHKAACEATHAAVLGFLGGLSSIQAGHAQACG